MIFSVFGSSSKNTPKQYLEASYALGQHLAKVCGIVHFGLAGDLSILLSVLSVKSTYLSYVCL